MAAYVIVQIDVTDPEAFESLLVTLKFESDRQAVIDRLGLGG